MGDLLHSINEDVARLPEPILRKLSPVLRAAESELEKDLRFWLSKVTDGEERFTAYKLRGALYQMRGAISSMGKVTPELRRGLKSGAEASLKLSQQHLHEELTQLSSRFSGSLAPIPLAQAAKLIDKTLLDRFAHRSKVWDEAARGRIRLELAKGVLRGETMHQLTTRLAGKAVKGALKDAAGAAAKKMFSPIWTRAEVIVRTEVIYAYNSVKMDQLRELYKEDNDMRSRWDAALDGRTCPACRDLDGKVVQVGEEFPGGILHPPAHPRCRCCCVAWKASWEADYSKR